MPFSWAARNPKCHLNDGPLLNLRRNTTYRGVNLYWQLNAGISKHERQEGPGGGQNILTESRPICTLPGSWEGL